MRQPIKIGARAQKRKDIASTMAAGGINRRELSQLLGVGVSQKMNNWLIDAQGQLFRAGQMSSVFNYSNWRDISLYEHWFDEFYMVAYQKVSNGQYELKVLDLENDELQDIYQRYSGPTGTPFSFQTNGLPVSGQKYANYFFVGSTPDFVFRIRAVVRSIYNTVTTPFIVGETVTGQTSGAIATVLEVNDANKHLSIGNVTGTFIDGEQILGSVAGDGVMDGGQFYTEGSTTTEIKALYLYSFVAPSGSLAGARIHAGNHKDDRTLLQYSNVDDGSNPPFDVWQTGAAANQGGKIYNKNADRLNTITSAGDTVIVGYDVNNIGFTIDTIDVGGTQTKITPIVFNDTDKGMAPGAISTSKGVFYGVDKIGFYQLLDGGQTNAPFSRNEKKISLNLEDGYFDDVDMTRLKIAHNPQRNLVIFSYSKASYSPNTNVKNNAQFTYNTETGAIGEMNLGLDIIISKEEKIYATGTYVDKKVIGELEHDTSNGTYNSLVQIDDTHFILAYSGGSNDGFIKTFSTNGTTSITEIDSVEHEVGSALQSSLIKIDATHFALAYRGSGDTAVIKTFSIDGSYLITEIDELEHEVSQSSSPSLILLDSTHFALAFTFAGDGIIKTFSIDGGFLITEIDELEHDSSGNAVVNSLVLIDSTHFALAFRGADSDGFIKTFSINGSYVTTEIDSLEHELVLNNSNSLVKIKAGYYVLAYSGEDGVGIIKTFGINGSFDITEIESFEHSAIAENYNSLAIVDDSNFILACDIDTDGGTLKIFSMETDGTGITEDSVYNHSVEAEHNSLIILNSDDLALAYADENTDGVVKTVTIGLLNNDNNDELVGNIFEVFAGKTNGTTDGQTTATFEQEFRPTGITGLFDVQKIIIQTDTDENSKLDVVFTGIDEDGVETEYTRTIDTSDSDVPFGKDTLYEFEIEIPQIWRVKVKLEDNDSTVGTAVNAINYVKISFVDRGEEIIQDTTVITS